MAYPILPRELPINRDARTRRQPAPPPPPIAPPPPDEQWPPSPDLSDLSTLPAHVRRAMKREGMKVQTPTLQELQDIERERNRKIAGFHVPSTNTIYVKDAAAIPIFRKLPPNTDKMSLTPSTARHELGHAVARRMEARRPSLSPSTQRFRSICTKYKAGTVGGGGGMGEYVTSYHQDCWELFASALAMYYSEPSTLYKADPILFQFMKEVDLEIQRWAPSGRPSSTPPPPRK